ncbi:MAG: hypothetical protein ACT4O3_08210 [Elusimicrobiota bacterium]
MDDVQERAEEQFHQAAEKAGDMADNARGRFNETLRAARGKAKTLWSRARERGEDMGEEVGDEVRSLKVRSALFIYPAQTIGLALLAGLAVGWLLHRK